MKLLDFNKITSTSVLAILIILGLDGKFTPATSLESEGISQVNASGFISPNSFEASIPLDRKITFERSITVNVEDIVETITTSTAPEQLDILFLADNTDSMGAAIANVQENATSLLNSLSETYDDLQVGVARYYGDPQETVYSYEDTGIETDFSKTFTYLNVSKTCISGQGEEYPCYKYQVNYTEGTVSHSWTSFINEARYLQYGDSFTQTWTGTNSERIEGEVGAENAYQLQTVMSSDLNSALTAIDNWSTGLGGDWEEGNFFGLHQAATNGADINGYATGHNTNWRNDAKKIIVWFGDAQSHVNTVTQAQAIEALAAQDISVIAIHTKSTEKSLTEGLNGELQASSIANATDGAFADVYSSELSETIETLIGKTVTETITTAPSIDLSFSSQGNTNGLEVSYICTDNLGCNGVKDGETRKFTMEITAKSAGTYNFQTLENSTKAEASNTITTVYPD